MQFASPLTLTLARLKNWKMKYKKKLITVSRTLTKKPERNSFSSSSMTQQMHKPSEEELNVITRVARSLAPRFTFGFYDTDDIEQEAIIIGISALPKYDEGRGPLENFMFTHVRNRLKTFKRDNFCRPDSNKDDERIKRSKEIKRNLARPIDIDSVRNIDSESNVIFETDYALELDIENVLTKINQNLPIELRADYLRMRAGVHVPKPRRKLIEEEVNKILRENYYDG